MVSDLTDILRGTEPDRTMMAVGNNLSLLRLNLSSSYPIYPYFLSPWSDTQKLPGFAVEPGYYIPFSYREAKASPPAQERPSSFSDEALFYMFYSFPNDVIQMESAKELFNRNWRYSKEMKVWITKQVNEQGKPIKAIEPESELERVTEGLFIIFDPVQWIREEKELRIVWQSIELNLSN
ncbi:hypothetical protein BDF21DRAFT_331713 [Thamnidium elegans]|nr:hypothetical protein BDF21DRAFT_331713 [Thamnidium elegans]